MRDLPRLTMVARPLAAALFEHQINGRDDLETLTFCLRRWHSVQEAEERLVFSTFDPTIVVVMSPEAHIKTRRNIVGKCRLELGRVHHIDSLDYQAIKQRHMLRARPVTGKCWYPVT